MFVHGYTSCNIKIKESSDNRCDISIAIGNFGFFCKGKLCYRKHFSLGAKKILAKIFPEFRNFRF